MKHVNGGIEVFIEHIKDRNAYNLPLRNQAFLFYHIAKSEIYDPDLFLSFENQVKSVMITLILYYFVIDCKYLYVE